MTRALIWPIAPVIVVYLLAAAASRSVAPSWYTLRLSATGVVAMMVLWLLAVGVHELGHVLGGWWRDLRCHLFACGPVLLVREEGRLQLKLNRSPMLWLGAVGCGPSAEGSVEG